MRRFSKKKDPEKVYEKLTHKIILAALKYRIEVLTDVDNKISADAGAEILYFLINWIDRLAFQTFNVEKRNEIYDVIYKKVISAYCKSILKSDIPKKGLFGIATKMLETLNKRQTIYSKCTLVISKLPYAGTMEFALSFYIHKALGKTNRDNVNDILTGKEKIKKSDLIDLPDLVESLNDSVFIKDIMIKSKIPELIKGL